MAFIVALKKKGGGKGNEVEFDEMDLLRSDAKVPLPTKEDPAYIMEDVLKKKIIGRTVTWRSMRVVLTQHFLGFAKVERSADEEGDDVVWMTDHIPLHEIISCRYAVNNDEAEAEAERKRKEAENEGLGVIERLNQNKKQEAPETLGTGQAINEEDLAFTIKTVPDGVNGGKTYVYRCKSKAELDKWFNEVKTLATRRKTEHEQRLTQEVVSASCLTWLSHKCDLLYRKAVTRYLTSLMVCGSFAVEIWEAEYMYTEWEDPAGKELFESLLFLADLTFTIYFMLEVSINFVAHLDQWRRWFRSAPASSVCARAMQHNRRLTTCHNLMPSCVQKAVEHPGLDDLGAVGGVLLPVAVDAADAPPRAGLPRGAALPPLQVAQSHRHGAGQVAVARVQRHDAPHRHHRGVFGAGNDALPRGYPRPFPRLFPLHVLHVPGRAASHVHI